MAKLVYSLNVSLDGYVDHDKFAPGPALFRHWIEDQRSVTGSLYGRVLYEMMRYWEGDTFDQDDPALEKELHEYARAWRETPKWVVSRTLETVGPNATLIGADLEGEVRALKAAHDGVIEVSGPTLAHSLGTLGLIDEYRLYYRPVVLGTGKPFFAGALPPLKFVASDRIGEDAVRLTYVPA